jgi:beta-lactam-binding protein with PASTA domain
MCHVPNVVGLRLAKAKTKIRARHCRVGTVTWVHSPLRKKGRVVSQTPKGGKTLRRGARIKLRVGR